MRSGGRTESQRQPLPADGSAAGSLRPGRRGSLPGREKWKRSSLEGLEALLSPEMDGAGLEAKVTRQESDEPLDWQSSGPSLSEPLEIAMDLQIPGANISSIYENFVFLAS